MRIKDAKKLSRRMEQRRHKSKDPEAYQFIEDIANFGLMLIIRAANNKLRRIKRRYEK